MRILISSHLFAPSVGGIEQVTAILAEEFAAMGQTVGVVTTTLAAPTGEPPPPYAIHRQPDAWQLWRLVRRCDVFFQSNVSVAMLWPALLQRKPTVVACHVWITQPDGRLGARERFKRFALRLVSRNVAVSRAVAASLPVPCTVMPNPYRENIFFVDTSVARDRDVVFLGRLVSDKGADVVIEALRLLRLRGVEPGLTVIGDGPEAPALRRQAAEAGLSAQVRFIGTRTGSELRRELNRHRIMVVPSRWAEPFGVVALEGAACGCFVIGANGGGLPEAIGPCGELFPSGDSGALASALQRRLNDPSPPTTPPIAAHLARHRRRAVAERYLEIFRAAIR